VAIKNLVTKSYGDQIPMTIESMANEFLWQQKDILVITWFIMIEMTLVLVTYKPTLGSLK
jgi:hypothetical protein